MKKETLAIIIYLGLIISSVLLSVIATIIKSEYFVIFGLILISLSILIIPFRGVFKKFACLMGWHCYENLMIRIGFDTSSFHTKCVWCGYEEIIDNAALEENYVK